MGNNTTDTEEQILIAAEKLFVANGFKATSTTDIAREAGCNQALLHYYYRTKENLFETVFNRKFEQLLALVRQPLFSDCSFIEKLERLVDAYFDMLDKNRGLPLFITNELLSNHERMSKLKESFRLNHFREEVYAKYSESVYEARRNGDIRDIEPIDLLFDVVALVVSSVVMAPIYSDYFDKGRQCEKEFIARRREEVKKLLVAGLTVKQ